MLRNAEGESEILLGNTQLIGLFFLLAVLLGISFTAGYMLGHGSFAAKKAAEAVLVSPPAPTDDPATPTRVVQPAPPTVSGADSPSVDPASNALGSEKPGSGSGAAEQAIEKKDKPATKVTPIGPPPSVNPPGAFEPQSGQTFLQVVAELHDSAAGTAGVLSRSGFNAHIVLAPNGKLYRVLVGPVKDKSDLAATRDALKKKGFLQIIVRSY